MTADARYENEVHERVLSQYLPAWCEAQETPVDGSTCAPDWSFLTPGLARAFLEAIDAGVVEIRDGWPTLRDARRTYLFEKGGGRVRLYREGFVEVAAAGVLTLRYGWNPDRLSFQSPRRGRARVWAFDLIAYTDHDRSDVAIAAEAKWRQHDALTLLRALTECGRRGDHHEDECQEKTSDHRKYEGLIAFRPQILWIIGPDAFTRDPDLVFDIHVYEGEHVTLSVADPSRLAAPA